MCGSENTLSTAAWIQMKQVVEIQSDAVRRFYEMLNLQLINNNSNNNNVNNSMCKNVIKSF